MVQATFYAMLLNNVIELGVVSGFMAVDLKLILEGLRWTSFKSWLSCNSRDLLREQLRQRAPSGGVRGLVNSQEESSGSTDLPPPSSDEE